MTTEKGKVNIDSYDFFAYLIPGVVVGAVLIVALTYWHQKDIFWLYGEILLIKDYEYLTVLILFLVSAYLLGHIVATFSAIIYDRIFVQKIFGYPYVAILVDKRDNLDGITQNFYRVLVTLLYLAALLFIGMGFPSFAKSCSVGIWISTYCLGALLPLRWIDSALGRVAPDKMNASTTALFKVLRLYRVIMKGALMFLSRPFRLTESMISHLMGLNRAFPEKIRQRFKLEFRKKFKLNPDKDISSETHWLTYWYVCEGSSNLRARLQKFLSLYGFTRNIAGGFILSALMICAPASLKSASEHLTYISLTLFFLGILMSIRYYYLYSNYHSRTLYRGFLAIAASSN